MDRRKAIFEVVDMGIIKNSSSNRHLENQTVQILKVEWSEGAGDDGKGDWAYTVDGGKTKIAQTKNILRPKLVADTSDYLSAVTELASEMGSADGESGLA